MLFSTQSTPEDLSLPDGRFTFYPSFLEQQEAWICFRELEFSIPWRQDEIVMAGKKIPVPRLQAWFGEAGSNYGYSGLALTPLPWTPLLLDLKERIEKSTGTAFNSVLANYYRNGSDSVSWHADDEKELGPDPVIASLSLGSSRRFRLKSRQNPATVYNCTLVHGSLLLMGSGTQRNYLHQIPKEKSIFEPRINLTFRYIHGA